MRIRGALATAFALLFVCPPAAAEPFMGQFELKDLESAPGSFEFQSQNAWSWGLLPRRIASDRDGVEFDELSLTEVGAELVAVLVSREGNGAGFGVVAELEGPLDQEDSNTLVLGAIIEFQSARWFAAAVPMQFLMSHRKSR